jgi:hypothetical protein
MLNDKLSLVPRWDPVDSALSDPTFVQKLLLGGVRPRVNDLSISGEGSDQNTNAAAEVAHQAADRPVDRSDRHID